MTTETIHSPNWGPTGQTVYERTYRRTHRDGTKETWPETVERVVTGNLSLVYGKPETWPADVQAEHDELAELMRDFKILPAGRHLWASGVPGRQFLFNCHVAGWGSRFSDHFEFTFLRLMEGGGVGSNYSSQYLSEYRVERPLDVHIVCDPSHPDYEKMRDEGLLSDEYTSEWSGSFDVHDSREGWAAALVDLLDTFTTTDHVAHMDRVYDVTNVRAEGSRLKTFGGSASGPLPFARMMRNIAAIMNHARPDGLIWPLDCMEIDHEIGQCVVAGGNRRSARMSMIHWRDPDVFEFMRCKRDGSKHWTTNISVEVDNDFLEAVNDPDHLDHLRANAVMVDVAAGMLTNGEPGLWNSSLSNMGEPNPVFCTNPCGEIALEQWENCNLGHVNLDAFAPSESHMVELMRAHRLMTRFLIRATYGDVNDDRQADKLARNRRIGVGHFGVQGFLVKSGIRYSDAPGSVWFRNLLADLRRACREEARRYAFDLRIPEPVKVTTVAPTGTIAKMPGVTEGIHPIYSRFFIRRVRFSTVDPEQYVMATIYEALGYHLEADKSAANTVIVSFPTQEKLVAEVEALGLPADMVESVDELSVETMLAFQAMYQAEYADNAVSFTVNVPEGSLATVELADTLIAFLPKLKGTTVMVDGTREQAPYERITRELYEAATARTVADSVDDECSTGACPVR